MAGYEFMPQIVSHAEGSIRHHLWSLYWLTRMTQAKCVVELGVRSGDSTRALLAGVMDTGGVMFSYDQHGDAYKVREVTEGFGIRGMEFERWQCITSDSVEARELWDGRDVPLLFIDTEHSLELTKKEISAWHDKVTGVMAFHDSHLDEPGRDGVWPAIVEFMTRQRYQGWSYERHQVREDGDTGLAIVWKTK